jgi:site-specific DNA-methyltransferase (adenine-specific)
MQLFNGDCLEIMKELPDNSIDFILADPPYGTTQCKWDNIIPYEPMWAEIKRIRKDNTVIALFGTEPFSSYLRLSNINEYKYDWVWKKTLKTNYLNAKKMPLRVVENIHIFYKRYKYYPQNLIKYNKITKRGKVGNHYGKANTENIQEFTNYPINFLEFNSVANAIHPTQKPAELLEYLIKTYTLENETVLDFTMGSGSTGVACVNTSRDFIGIELDREYYETATTRIKEASGS